LDQLPSVSKTLLASSGGWTKADLDWREATGRIENRRNSEDEAILIQQYGTENTSNNKCSNYKGDFGVFASCRSLGGELRGACANCAWTSKHIDCSRPSVNAGLKQEAKERTDKANCRVI